MYFGPEHYLNRDAAAGKVMSHARLLLKLSRRFAAIAPVGMRSAARVANYKSGVVVIHADNGAVAAKLRQMSRRLRLNRVKPCQWSMMMGTCIRAAARRA